MGRYKILESKEKTIQIRVSSDLFNEFEKKAKEKGVSKSNLGRQIIEVYLE